MPRNTLGFFAYRSLIDTTADPSTYDVVTRGLHWTMQVMRTYLLERYQDAYLAAQVPNSHAYNTAHIMRRIQHAT